MELSNIIFKGDFLKTVKNLPEKWYNLSNERTVVGAKFGAKALVEKCGNVGMTCVARGAVMPLMFRLLKGESLLIYQQDSFEPRTARKRVGWDKPPALVVGCMTIATNYRTLRWCAD